MFSSASKTIILSTCFVLLVVSKSLSFSLPLDSVGVQREGNKTFILHKVDPQETLFSLAKRYNVKTSQIEIENPEIKQGLKVGQILRIPYVSKASTTISQTPSGRTKTHIVGQGQTLYSISRIYKVSVDNLKKWNNLTSNEVSIGKEIFVSAPPVSADIQENNEQPVNQSKEAVKHVPNFKYDAKGNKVHLTEAGQTLFNISQIYSVSVDDLKKWNSLSSNEISTGQEIIVEKPKEKDVAQVKVKPADSVEKPAVVTNPSNNHNKSDSNKLKEYAPITVKPTSSSNDFNKVTERGLAEVIDESGDNPKFLALHKTANIGTIIQVKNELNNLYIFARVIGKLPETGSNDKLIIKLSKKAYDKLGAVDRRFPVEVSYVPQ